MDYITALSEELNKVYTENGDLAYATSGSYCLDFFGLIGGMRGNHRLIMPLFLKAFAEDRLLAIKLLFYTRDVRGGLGERDAFRLILNFLGNFYPAVAAQLIPFIPEYGRYDDFLVLLYTPVKQDVINAIKDQLAIDIDNKENGKPVSLLAKWLPSINTSSKEARDAAAIIAEALGMTQEKYRKTLSALRKNIIIENNLREKDYSFDYENVPSKAYNKYIEAFIRNDKERYESFLEQVEKGEKKIKTDAIFPYELVRKVENLYHSPDRDNQDLIKGIDLQWKSIKRSEYLSNTIVVRDGSGSMTWSYLSSVLPIDVATSLAILLSEQLTGPFKDTFITFSANPKLVKLAPGTLYDKVLQTKAYDECSNTDIAKVYKLLLKVALSNKVKPEDMIKRVIIISDMEFDYAVDNMSTFESFKEMYTLAGFEMPELVFWNVASRNGTLPVTMNEKNVKLISGSSNKVMDIVMNNITKDPYQFMLEALERYEVLNVIKF